MKASTFLKKIFSGYVWGNLLAMAAVVILLSLGVKYGLGIYTHHGESIAIPNVKNKSFSDAKRMLVSEGMKVVVSDTGYVKTLPPDCVLEQSPAPGERVKSGHIVYLTVNASHTPTITIPDLIDNSSLREAMAKLSAMGFKVGMPEYVTGERDWVYGITVNGKHVVTGDKVSVEETLIIQVGNGLRDSSDSVDYIDPVYHSFDDEEDGEEVLLEDMDDPSEPSSRPAEPAESAGGESPSQP